jgi:hypothetical protein
LKVTDWEGKLDSEMSIAVGQRKAMCVHINRAQLPYLCFVMRICSVCEVSALGQCESSTCRFAFVITPAPGSIPGPGCLEL